MNALDIDKDVPIPPAKRERQPPVKVDDLGIGDSRAVPKARRSTLSTAIQRAKFFHPGWEFTTRVIDGNTIRVWRVR